MYTKLAIPKLIICTKILRGKCVTLPKGGKAEFMGTGVGRFIHLMVRKWGDYLVIRFIFSTKYKATCSPEN